MKTKLFLIVSLFVIGFVGIVFAAEQMSKDIAGYGTIQADYVEAGYVNFEKGWNLVHGLPSPDWLSGGDLDSSNIKAIYGFNPVTQKYIRFYPNPNRDELSSSDLRIDTLISTSAFWVYSDKKGSTEYWTLQPTPINEKRLIRGWNFMGITPDMIGKSLNDIKGDCNIEKMYGWDNEGDGRWDIITLDRELTDFVLSFGLVIRVSSDCQFGSPPSLPGNGDSNPEINNEDLILNKNFGSLTVNGILGQAYIEREYRNFPLSNMEKGNAIKYGSPVGINAIVIKFDQSANNLLSSVLSVYSDSDWTKSRASNGVYDIYQNSNTLNRVGLWTSNNYLILIHSSDGFHGDGEDIARDYLAKYPSTLN